LISSRDFLNSAELPYATAIARESYTPTRKVGSLDWANAAALARALNATAALTINHPFETNEVFMPPP
jgi:threonine aldolase